MQAKKLHISKMKEKNNIIQISTLNLEEHLKTKVELSEIIHGVDFDRFRIQNQQLAAKINVKSKEYSKIKSNYAKASRVSLSLNLLYYHIHILYFDHTTTR